MARWRKRRRRRRVPEALRRVYGDLAQTLQATILSLLPPPPTSPAECRCRGRRCLGCGSSAYLLRRDDPPDYRILLTRAFCVVSLDAPSPPRAFLSDGTPQRGLVRKTMELVLDDVHAPSNMLCSGRNEERCFSTIGEFLCTSAWDLLLCRIGCPLMTFLLRYSSIFVPVRNKSHYQVTGDPMDRVGKSKFSNTTPMSCNQQPLISETMQDMASLRNRLKRKRNDIKWRSNVGAAAVLDPNSSLDDVSSKSKYLTGKTDNKSKIRSRELKRVVGRMKDIQVEVEKPNMRILCCEDSSQKTSQCGTSVFPESVLQLHHQEMHLEKLKSPCTEYQYSENGSLTDNPSKSSGLCLSRKSRKHGRLCSWQRRRKDKVPEKNISGERNQRCSVLDSDCNICWPVQPSGPITFSSIDVGIMKDSESTASEDIEAIRGKNSHSLLSQDMCQGQIALSTKNANHRSKSTTNDGSEQQSHVGAENLYIHPQYLEESPEVEVLYDNHMIPAELLPEVFVCSMNKLNLQSHLQKIGSMCFYCLMMQSSQKVEIGDQIKRSYIFYSRSSSYSVFPRNHILNSLKPNNSGAICLMKHIFGFPDGCENLLTCVACSNGCAMKSQCLYHSLLGLLKSLIRNSQRCQRNKMMLKHCIRTSIEHSKDINRSKYEVVKQNSSMKMKKAQPSAKEVLDIDKITLACVEDICVAKNKSYQGDKADTRCSSTEILKENVESQYASFHELSKNVPLSKLHHEGRHPDVELIESYSKHQEVVSFIWAVCRSIVPVSLLGNSSCWRSLQKNISKFVKLHRFENFHLKQGIHGVKMSCYPFLLKVRSSECFCDGNSKSEFGESIKKSARKPSNFKMMLLGYLFRSWMHWFFSDMVIPMIRANFYVTERESRKHELFYYPKPVWRKLAQGAIATLEGQKFKLLDQASVRHIISKRSFGFSKVRFLPKDKCLRLLANLRASSIMRFPNHEFDSRYCSNGVKAKAETHQKHRWSCDRRLVRYRSVNSALKELYVILRRVKVEKPQLLGSSVFDYNDVYQKLHQFLSKLNCRSSKMPEIYIVVADVLKAFDCIDQDVLVGILENIFQNDEYVMRNHVKISCRRKSLKILYDHVSCDYSSSNSFTSLLDPSVRLFPSSSILIDQGIRRRIHKEKLLYLLQEHLKRNILQVEQNFYLQKVGISQGSVLSSLLCSYYYGHMERRIVLPYLQRNGSDLVVSRSNYPSNGCTTELVSTEVLCVESLKYDAAYLGQPNVTDLGKNNLLHFDKHDAARINAVAVGMECSTSGQNLLLRFIDDFLFISTSKEQATRFFNRMRRGFKAYNCFMNNKKFGANFDMTHNGHLINRVYTGADGISFLPWSGLLLNCQTLEIQADYTRYFDSNIRSSMTIKTHAKPLCHLKTKLFSFVRTRCHPVFYDSNINSPAIVSLNAYQAFLLCAMKFHCYVHSMQDITKLNPSYLLEMIERSFSYMYKHIKKLMHDIWCRFGIRPSLGLQKREIRWLGLSAYTCGLRKKHSKNKELLSLLRSRISGYGRIEDASPHLRYAVDESHSSFFSKMKF